MTAEVSIRSLHSILGPAVKNSDFFKKKITAKDNALYIKIKIRPKMHGFANFNFAVIVT